MMQLVRVETDKQGKAGIKLSYRNQFVTQYIELVTN
jgi:hypothetical protein